MRLLIYEKQLEYVYASHFYSRQKVTLEATNTTLHFFFKLVEKDSLQTPVIAKF